MFYFSEDEVFPYTQATTKTNNRQKIRRYKKFFRNLQNRSVLRHLSNIQKIKLKPNKHKD